MLDASRSIRNQRGIALVVALLALMFLSLLATGLMMSLNAETDITARTVREDRALNMAEAGVAEAIERIRTGEVPDNGNTKMVSQIFLVQAGSVPTLGTDSIALPTLQPSGDELPYSSATKGPDVLTVTYKTDAARSFIWRYASPGGVNKTTGQPIFVVTATGRVGDSKRTIVDEVVSSPVTTNCKAAIASGRRVQIINDTWFCGYNHYSNTPDWTAITKGRDGKPGSCNEDLSKQHWETGSGNLPGIWTTGAAQGTSNGGQWGSPTGVQQNQPGAGMYAGPWDVVGMTQAQFYAWIGAGSTNKNITQLNGVNYIQCPSGAIINGGDGDGFLFVDSNVLQIKGQVTFTGMIYCTGKIIIDGKLWVLGGLVAQDELKFHNGNSQCAVLYSSDAINNGISKYKGAYVTLSWREKP